MSRVKNEYRSNSRSVYNRFCATYPEAKISFEKWKSVLETANSLIREFVLETGDKFKLPWGLGSIAISKKKKKAVKVHKGVEYNNLPIDWAKTKKYGKYVYHLNSHTDGYSCKWEWFREEARFANSSLWTFKTARIASRQLTAFIRKSSSYYQIYKNWKNNGVLL